VATGGEQAFQKVARAFVRASSRKALAPPIELARLRRVLVIRTDDRVGNVLLTTPLVRALREGLPHVRIDWLLASRRIPLVDGLFLADTLIPYDKRAAARNPAVLSKLLWRLRTADYDLAIDAAHYTTFSLTAALMARWTGAPIRIGHDRGDAAYYYTHPVQTDATYDVAAKLSLLGPLGLRERGYELETSVGTSDESVRRVDEILSFLQLEDRQYFIVNPGARKLDRRFPAKRMGQIVKRIAAASEKRGVVVWGPGEEDLAREAVAEAGDAAVMAPATDLHALAGLLRRAALLLTNDTGPMHLGVACRTPTLALFTVGDWERWGHPIPTFRALDARGAHLEETNDVETAVEELLAAANSSQAQRHA
jgi:ADP-heptose:LPS heptosyltransferase